MLTLAPLIDKIDQGIDLIDWCYVDIIYGIGGNNFDDLCGNAAWWYLW